VEAYRVGVVTVIGWGIDIRASLLWGALRIRYDREQLRYQRFWLATQRAEMEVDTEV
jgi:hypothetical protein